MKRLAQGLLVALVALFPALASAAPRVIAAEHEGTLGRDVITWQSRAIVECDGASSVTLHAGGGEIPCERNVRETTTQPLDRKKPILHPALYAGDAVQVVTLHTEGDERIEPSDPSLERHVGYWRSSGVTDAKRHAAIAALHRDVATHEDPIFLEDRSSEVSLHGIAVELTTAQRSRLPAVIVIAIGSTLLVLALAWLYRRLSRDVEIERAEAALRREFEDLEGR